MTQTIKVQFDDLPKISLNYVGFCVMIGAKKCFEKGGEVCAQMADRWNGNHRICVDNVFISNATVKSYLIIPVEFA